VGESQAYPGLQKAVLVESRRKKPTEKIVAALLNLNLVRGERVEVWDWRAIEGVLDLTTETASQEVEDVLTRVLQKRYMGCISWDEGLKQNTYRQEEKKHVVGSMMANMRMHLISSASERQYLGVWY